MGSGFVVPQLLFVSVGPTDNTVQVVGQIQELFAGQVEVHVPKL